MLFYVIIGCDDFVFFFDGKGKKIVWDVWNVYLVLINVLWRLMLMLEKVKYNCMVVIERFVVLFYV